MSVFNGSNGSKGFTIIKIHALFKLNEIQTGNTLLHYWHLWVKYQYIKIIEIQNICIYTSGMSCGLEEENAQTASWFWNQ